MHPGPLVIRAFAAIAVFAIAALVSACRCGSDPNELRPTDTNGVVTIRYPNAPYGGHAFVQIIIEDSSSLVLLVP